MSRATEKNEYTRHASAFFSSLRSIVFGDEFVQVVEKRVWRCEFIKLHE